MKRLALVFLVLACGGGGPYQTEGTFCETINDTACGTDHNTLKCWCGCGICNPGDIGVWIKVPLDPC
jgi:hypothetical protein